MLRLREHRQTIDLAWQPLLYISTWIAALVLLCLGDFENIPPETTDTPGGTVEWVWLGLSLISPPVALLASHLIRHRCGAVRYRGFWLRLAADLGQFTALTTYTIFRLSTGDYHIYPAAIVIAAAIFTGTLVYMDCRALVKTEKIARTLNKLH
jgi:hypothetical protein